MEGTVTLHVPPAPQGDQPGSHEPGVPAAALPATVVWSVEGQTTAQTYSLSGSFSRRWRSVADSYGFPRITSYNVCYTKLLRLAGKLGVLVLEEKGRAGGAGAMTDGKLNLSRNNFV